MPGRLGVGSREVAVPRPQDQIRQGELERGHYLVLRMVPFIHRSFAHCYIFSLPQQVALALTSPPAGVKRGTDGIVGLAFPL